MHERRYNQAIERLRDPQRVERLEVARVVGIALEGLNNAKTVLDIGTGSGLFAEQFAAKGLRVTGLDANPEMLPAAREFVPTGTFQEGVAEKLPFTDGTFDLIFMGLVLHETDNVLAALREANRVAIKRLAVLEWPYEEGTFGPPLEHRVSPDRITSLAQQTGFEVTQILRLESLVLYLFDKVAKPT
ncbi:MAG TPA: class I SAM-dependent methyltransferase [Anaerolineaceae bacterium]|nr:class I SAM-dependent methyltransferase [Anaerolineaceae bacterium]